MSKHDCLAFYTQRTQKSHWWHLTYAGVQCDFLQFWLANRCGQWFDMLKLAWGYSESYKEEKNVALLTYM